MWIYIKKSGAPLIGYGRGDSVTTIPAIRRAFNPAPETGSTRFPVDERSIRYFEKILVKDYRRYTDCQ